MFTGQVSAFIFYIIAHENGHDGEMVGGVKRTDDGKFGKGVLICAPLT